MFSSLPHAGTGLVAATRAARLRHPYRDLGGLRVNGQHTIGVMVNGTRYERSVEPRLLLSDFLRHELGLTGTRVGCEHGGCGACTILYDGEPGRSCLVVAAPAHGH